MGGYHESRIRPRARRDPAHYQRAHRLSRYGISTPLRILRK